MGGDTPGQVVLGGVRKQDGHAMRSKGWNVNGSIPPWLSEVLLGKPWLPSVMDL